MINDDIFLRIKVNKIKRIKVVFRKLIDSGTIKSFLQKYKSKLEKEY